MTQRCLQCHKEIGWLLQQQRGLHAREAGVAKQACASCHPDHAGVGFRMVEWSEGSPTRFDHRRVGWALEGAHTEARCESCHATQYRVGEAAARSTRKSNAGWVGLERDCISCHRRDDVHDGALSATCESCHDARDWQRAPRFDHDKAGYRLDGRHVDVACNACHLTPRLTTRTNVQGERVPIFRPVAFKECSSCHDDPHRGRLSARCSECHSTSGFDRIDRREFDHGLTRYPLKGEHVRVPCASCHGRDHSRKQLQFATCASCHADVHERPPTIGGKVVECAACHTVSGFAPSTFTVAQHRATSYALEGKHQGVKCAACHTARSSEAVPSVANTSARATPGLAGPRKVVRLHPTAARCADCHADAHGGQRVATIASSTCESCHAVSGFTPSTFGREAHARTRLALDGKHASIACAACHGARRPALAAWPATTMASIGKGNVVLVGVDPTCTSCHVDPHAGRFGATGGGSAVGGCLRCHGTDAFRPSRVDVSVHAEYAMPLEGAHRAVPCGACHAEMEDVTRQAASTLVRGATSGAALPFSQSGRTCATCHDSPHGDQFAGRRGGDDCASCHGVDLFAPAARFDHESSAFSLRGAHASVACDRCHARVPVAGGAPNATRVRYLPLSTACERCHARAPGDSRTPPGSRPSLQGAS